MKENKVTFVNQTQEKSQIFHFFLAHTGHIRDQHEMLKGMIGVYVMNLPRYSNILSCSSQFTPLECSILPMSLLEDLPHYIAIFSVSCLSFLFD